MIVARSSLAKTGYIISNCVGIIDPSYTGNLLISLTKIDDSLPDITLPCKPAQLIFAPAVWSIPISGNVVSDTARGDGGFGSTNKTA